MGQSTSLDVQSGGEASGATSPGSTIGRNALAQELKTNVDFLHEQIRKHSRTLRQLTILTYDDLQSKVKELNELSSRFVDCNGKQLQFSLKDHYEGEMPSVMWKGLVRIRVSKINPETAAIEKRRDLNLKQFLQVYNTMVEMQRTIAVGLEDDEDDEDDAIGIKGSGHDTWDTELGEEAAATSSSSHNTPASKKASFRHKKIDMSASVLLDEFDPNTSSSHSSLGGKPLLEDDDELLRSSTDECCICMESKPEVSLPCAHSYCLPCIEQWNVDHKTCPICRETLENTDETWVLEDKPNCEDVQLEIKKSLFGLTK